jgi:hypothetical protein
VDEELFRQIVTKYLLPMFSGASLEPKSAPSTPAHQCVTYSDREIAIKPTQNTSYRLVIRRQASDPAEEAVIRSFADVFGLLMPTFGTPVFDDLLNSFTRRVAARAVSQHHEDLLLRILDQFDLWSTRLCEGKPIAASIGVDPAIAPGEVTLTDLWMDDYSAVLTNGVDTIIIASPQGTIADYTELPHGGTPSFAPDRFRAIASWATGNRVAVCLTRSGEILLFANERLVFARRSGIWHFLKHDSILSQMGCPRSEDVRRAIYESCLDASFARTGACVAVVTSGNRHRVSRYVDDKDLIERLLSRKARFMNRLIGTEFQRLNRRLRQELLAIDGAIVIGDEGPILAVGAIVRVPGGSTGGGRLAAAKALSSLGLGIKVSQDGGIQGYRRGGAGEAELAFSVC